MASGFPNQRVWGQDPIEGSLKTQLRVRVMALGNGYSHWAALVRAPLRDELRKCVLQYGRIKFLARGDNEGVGG